MTTPKIYVGTYAKYNNGSLQGEWLKLDDYKDKDEFLSACQELHKDEQDPELMFQDHEGIPEGMIKESWVDDRLWDWMALDANEQEVVQAYWEWSAADEDIDSALEHYQGTFNDLADYAETVQGELSGYSRDDKNPWNPINFIDWDALGNDLRISGVIFTVDCDNGVMVFDNN